jgi:hypothetical protein
MLDAGSRRMARALLDFDCVIDFLGLGSLCIRFCRRLFDGNL